jgi:hypothetical protein
MPKLKLFSGRRALSIHEVAAAMVMVTTCYLRKKPLPPAPTQKEPVLIYEARVKAKDWHKVSLETGKLTLFTNL